MSSEHGVAALIYKSFSPHKFIIRNGIERSDFFSFISTAVQTGASCGYISEFLNVAEKCLAVELIALQQFQLKINYRRAYRWFRIAQQYTSWARVDKCVFITDMIMLFT